MLASLERSRANERRFLADASHELRTPITSLLGNVHYARRHGADADVLADLERDAERMARLVDDLLVLERQAGDGEASRAGRGDADSPVELDRLVQTVAAEHEAVRLGVIEPVRLRGDAEALRRVVANLIENAIVHGPSGQPVDVSLTRRDGTSRLSVSDQGPGPDAASAGADVRAVLAGAGGGRAAGIGPGTGDHPGDRRALRRGDHRRRIHVYRRTSGGSGAVCG